MRQGFAQHLSHPGRADGVKPPPWRQRARGRTTAPSVRRRRRHRQRQPAGRRTIRRSLMPGAGSLDDLTPGTDVASSQGRTTNRGVPPESAGSPPRPPPKSPGPRAGRPPVECDHGSGEDCLSEHRQRSPRSTRMRAELGPSAPVSACLCAVSGKYRLLPLSVDRDRQDGGSHIQGGMDGGRRRRPAGPGGGDLLREPVNGSRWSTTRSGRCANGDPAGTVVEVVHVG
jgi:hypothetical protein